MAPRHECSEQEIDFLFRVIDEGKIEFVQWAMEQGVDPNLESPKSGATLLTEAISALQPSIVELLVKYGADPDFEDDEGVTPLELAKKAGTPAMVACLEAAAGAASDEDDEDDEVADEDALSADDEDESEDEEDTEADDADDSEEEADEDADDDESDDEDSDDEESEEDEVEFTDEDLKLIQVKPLSNEAYYDVMSRISQMAIDRDVLLVFLKAQHCRTAEEALGLEDGAVAENLDLYRALKLFGDVVADEA